MPREADPLDLTLVAQAGDPLLRGPVTEEELALAGACAELEGELRRREWQDLEAVLAHVRDGRFVFPEAEAEQHRLIGAVCRLPGWCLLGAEGAGE